MYKEVSKIGRKSVSVGLNAGKAAMVSQSVKSFDDFCEGRKSMGEATCDVAKVGIRFGVEKAVGTAAAGVTTAALASTGIAGVVGGTLAGGACLAAAPVAVGVAAASLVGGFVSSLFDW